MEVFDFKVRVPVGIHVRNAMLLCQRAVKYQCDITIQKGDHKANAKKLMEIMLLRVKCGDEIRFIMEGDHEKEAYLGIVELCEGNF